PLYRRLMYDPAYRQLPWDRAHMWVVDERRVSFDDERSNFRQLDDLIAQHSGIPAANVHPMMAMQDDADRQYEAELLRVLGRRDKGHDRLDFVVLGMGGDAHTASLFPHSPALFDAPDSTKRLVRINAGQHVTPPDRVTMTFDLLNAARFVAILVTGSGKRDTIARVSAAYTENAASGNFPVEELPILGIRPHAGELRWYLDHDACPV
ncbi:MAG: 6-phosphogluconolactonase, partial [Phycisphaerales bacterium]|nr:6-phosphogluconolactonase [Phycisphaerales bacterium]